jgi:hypothetical protein
VHSAGFIVRDIGQSSPYPGDNNTLSVTIRPNLDLVEGSVVTLAMLEALDLTTGGKPGAIALFDDDSNPGSKSTLEDQMYFAAQNKVTQRQNP